MKPFDFERACKGDPVMTLSGNAVINLTWIDNLQKFAGEICRGSGSFEYTPMPIILLFNRNGTVFAGRSPYKENALCMARVKKQGWVNVYKDGMFLGRVYATKDEATANKDITQNCVDTVLITWEE